MSACNLPLLERLSYQILKNGEGNWKIPWIKINKEEKDKCDQYIRNNCSKNSQTIATIQTEIGNSDICTNFPDTIITAKSVDNLNNQQGTNLNATCQMCSRDTDCVIFTFRVSESEFMQEVLNTSKSIETSTQCIFCEYCFQCISKLREFYQNYKNAQNIYQETLLRVRYFQKCAKEVISASSDSTSYSISWDCDDDNFEESWDVGPINIKTEPEPSNQIAEPIAQKHALESPKLKTYQRKPYKPTYNYKGKLINRKDGRTEEEYQEHRRLQRQQHYLAKKEKLNKPTVEDNPGPMNPQNSEPLPASLPLSLTSDNSIFTTTDIDSNSYQSTDTNDPVLKQEVVPEEESKSSNVKQKEKSKKKYDYRGKTIRRRNGLTDEQYREHRRAQSSQYYFEWKKKTGKLAYGPKPLRPTLRAKLERSEKVTFDSNNLPAKSSWGAQVPVLQLDDDGKRFSYRNTEFSKQNEETYACGKCGHTTKNVNVMKKHIAKIHFDKEHGYKCSYCEKSFYYQFQLRNHEGTHTEKGAGIQCDECGKSFKHSSGYYFHRRSVHLGIKPHECQLCEKQFGTKKDLRKHKDSYSHRLKESGSQ